MADKNENQNIYVIPPNFIESGTFFGGMFKFRNAIEAGILAIGVGLPVINLNMPLTTRIIIICLTALPLALFGLIGISGESLSSFVIIFFKFLKNRRVVGKDADTKEQASSSGVKKNRQEALPSALRAGIFQPLKSEASG